jgi:hypothetical protein
VNTCRRKKEENAQTYQAAIVTLRTEVENLSSFKEDLTGQLRDKDNKLANAKGKNSPGQLPGEVLLIVYWQR